MIQTLKNNKYETRSGWKRKYDVISEDVSMKEVTIACGWNKHFLKNKTGFIYVLDGVGHVSINHKDEKIITANSYIHTDEHSIINFQYSQLRYLYFKNMDNYDKITIDSSTKISNHPGQTTIIYVLDGVGNYFDQDKNKTVIREGEAIELTDEELVELNGKLTFLKLNS